MRLLQCLPFHVWLLICRTHARKVAEGVHIVRGHVLNS